MNSRPNNLARLYLIRHGETAWSLSGQHTGRTDIPLTARGEDAARNLGQRLRDIRFAHVLTSPLQRAHQTCALAGLTPVAEIEPDLAEWDYGDYEGRTTKDILASRSDWNLFRDGSPNGETPAQISTRADRLIARLRGLNGNVALFSHGHFGRVLATRWIGLSVEQAQHLLLNTASLSVLGYEHGRTDQPAIALWNSAAPETFDPASNQDSGENQTRWLEEKHSKLWRTLKLAGARWAQEDGDQRAAAFAYYLLLSLLPLAILLVAAGSWFVEREVATQAVVNLVNHYTPLTSEQERGIVETIRDWLNARGKISLAALPLLLWGALKFLRTLIRTTNRVWHSPTYNWWRLPLKSLGLLGITASAVLIGILLPGVARPVGPWLTTHLEFPQWAFALMFHLIPGLVLFYGLIMIYRLAPSRTTRFSEIWLGALAATVLIWLGERLFLVYATNFAHFNVLYGALGGIVALLLWLYLSSCVGVFGICFCAARAKVRGEVTTLDAKAEGTHASGEQGRKSPAKSDPARTAT